jgi:hypothetical protein
MFVVLIIIVNRNADDDVKMRQKWGKVLIPVTGMP